MESIAVTTGSERYRLVATVVDCGVSFIRLESVLL